MDRGSEAVAPHGPEPCAVGGGGKEAAELVRGDPSWEQDLLRNRQGVVKGEGGGAHPQKQRQPLWTGIQGGSWPEEQGLGHLAPRPSPALSGPPLQPLAPHPLTLGRGSLRSPSPLTRSLWAPRSSCTNSCRAPRLLTPQQPGALGLLINAPGL